MRVTTRSSNPHTRTARTPYTEVTLKVDARGSSTADLEQRKQELTLLALLPRVLNPRVGLRRLNATLRTLLPADAVRDADEGEA